jgi:alpha-glucosidase
MLPFTRYIGGAADYTICYYTNRIKTTHAHQLAMAAVYYSPIQTLFWYDKPSQSKDEPELEFWRKIPTTWDETKVVNGKIGEYITIARKSGNDWFLGCMTNNAARKLTIDFSFLTVGKKYKAHLYFDDASVNTATKVGMKTISVDYTSKLEVDLLASGGYAIWFEEEK